MPVPPVSQRNQYAFNNNTYAGASFTSIPPMHLPTGMGSGAGPGHQPGAAAYGYHGQLNSGDDARYQANPGGGAALPISEATHLPYPQIHAPVGSVEGGQPAPGGGWRQ